MPWLSLACASGSCCSHSPCTFTRGVTWHTRLACAASFTGHASRVPHDVVSPTMLFLVFLLVLLRNHSQQPIDQRVGIDVVGAGVEVEHQAVPQHRRGERLNVGEIDVVLAGQDRPGPWPPAPGTARPAGWHRRPGTCGSPPALWPRSRRRWPRAAWRPPAGRRSGPRCRRSARRGRAPAAAALPRPRAPCRPGRRACWWCP